MAHVNTVVIHLVEVIVKQDVLAVVKVIVIPLVLGQQEVTIIKIHAILGSSQEWHVSAFL